jgi:hypothetical protein
MSLAVGFDDPSNMQNFTTDSYTLEKSGSWCVKPGSIYTNKNANFHYFNNKCGDPYTYYSYWYRRFPSQNKYLNCYNLPFRDPLLHNAYGYERSGKQCVRIPNNKYNVTIDGFKFYDSEINATNNRVSLRKY